MPEDVQEDLLKTEKCINDKKEKFIKEIRLSFPASLIQLSERKVIPI